MRKIKPLREKPLFGDYIVIAAVVLAAALSFLLTLPGNKAGNTVNITSPGGVSVRSLFEDAEFCVEGADGIVMTVVIEDGSVFAADSGCPDRLCVNKGKIDRPGETIVCLPGHIIISIGGEKEGGDYDCVAG
ncbi:MAG: NusG domain II-containing protein [Clostridiales bacterium]|nr:NusG domain II-containing protein [Clostridiales bacterium]